MTKHKEYFELYPDIEVFYFTTDGQAFFTEHEAYNHSLTVGDNEVLAVTREEGMLDNEEEEEIDTTTEVEAEEKLKAFDLDTDPPNYNSMKKLVKELGLTPADMKAPTLLDALVAKKAELISANVSKEVKIDEKPDNASTGSATEASTGSATEESTGSATEESTGSATV